MQFGQRAMLRYTEFTSNECLPAGRAENRGNLRDEDMDHSVAGCSPVAHPPLGSHPAGHGRRPVACLGQHSRPPQADPRFPPRQSRRRPRRTSDENDGRGEGHVLRLARPRLRPRAASSPPSRPAPALLLQDCLRPATLRAGHKNGSEGRGTGYLGVARLRSSS
jgi:hypothetical protein